MDEPMVFQCTERESGGVRCEAWLLSPDEEHAHWISQATIDAHLARKNAFYTHIDLTGVRNPVMGQGEPPL